MKNLIFLFCLLFAGVLSGQSLPDSIRVTLVDTTYIIEQITLDDGTPRLPARIEIVRAQGQGEFLNFLRGATYQAYTNYYQAVLQYRAAERAAREIMRATKEDAYTHIAEKTGFKRKFIRKIYQQIDVAANRNKSSCLKDLEKIRPLFSDGEALQELEKQIKAIQSSDK